MRMIVGLCIILLAVGCAGSRAANRNTEGIALYRAGDVRGAVAKYAEAVRLAPDVPEYHCNLGAALGQTGQYDAAALEFEQALRLRPGYPEASRGLTITRAAIEGRQAAAFQK